MTVFEKLKQLSLDQLIDVLDKNDISGNEPWYTYYDKHYCQKCKSEFTYIPYLQKEAECAWCELHDDKCKFFPDMDEVPSGKQLIKMWLESEAED